MFYLSLPQSVLTEIKQAYIHRVLCEIIWVIAVWTIIYHRKSVLQSLGGELKRCGHLQRRQGLMKKKIIGLYYRNRRTRCLWIYKSGYLSLWATDCGHSFVLYMSLTRPLTIVQIPGVSVEIFGEDFFESSFWLSHLSIYFMLLWNCSIVLWKDFKNVLKWNETWDHWPVTCPNFTRSCIIVNVQRR